MLFVLLLLLMKNEFVPFYDYVTTFSWYIEYNDLTGLIPKEILLLASLEVLSLCYKSNVSDSLLLFCIQSNCNSNTFEGSIPSELGSSVTSLHTDTWHWFRFVLLLSYHFPNKCFLKYLLLFLSLT